MRAVPAKPQFDVNWFSDGGLTANLPVHFFDARCPPGRPSRSTWPPSTRPEPAARRAGEQLPPDGEPRRPASPYRPLGGQEAVGAAPGLRDVAVRDGPNLGRRGQLIMPGYRDRVVTVYQDGNEGGLNLSMPKDVVRRLSDRGRFAARRIKDRFAGPAPGVPAAGWDNHRWIRFRAATAGLSEWLAGFERGIPRRTLRRRRTTRCWPMLPISLRTRSTADGGRPPRPGWPACASRRVGGRPSRPTP